MGSWARGHMSAVAIALLVSIATLGIPHGAEPGHDSEFGFVAVAHDASAHQIRPVHEGDPGHTVHCVACHWARSFRPAAENAYSGALVTGGQTRPRSEDSSLLRPTTVSQPPLRSPPSLHNAFA